MSALQAPTATSTGPPPPCPWASTASPCRCPAPTAPTAPSPGSVSSTRSPAGREPPSAAVCPSPRPPPLVCPADSIWDKTEGKTLNIQACRGITIGDGDSSAERFCDENYAWDDPIPSKSCSMSPPCHPIPSLPSPRRQLGRRRRRRTRRQAVRRRQPLPQVLRRGHLGGDRQRQLLYAAPPAVPSLVCAAEGDWPQTPRLTTASLACSNGAQITRYCNSFGQWEEADASACGCNPANGYLETLLNTTATTSCDLGSRSATCLPPYGQWGEDDLSNCCMPLPRLAIPSLPCQLLQRRHVARDPRRLPQPPARLRRRLPNPPVPPRRHLGRRLL